MFCSVGAALSITPNCPCYTVGLDSMGLWPLPAYTSETNLSNSWKSVLAPSVIESLREISKKAEITYCRLHCNLYKALYRFSMAPLLPPLSHCNVIWGVREDLAQLTALHQQSYLYEVWQTMYLGCHQTWICQRTSQSINVRKKASNDRHFYQ